ncbi:MAG: HesA/MoeB/ThiF family protein [Flavobacteriales bacterium]|nr:HesA/MoeB/ThiF family protein [Flavobacteriales bacterium]
MISEKEHIRYGRHLLLKEVGAQGQQKLKQASVLVVGAGGLGCPALQYLVAAGVGTIGIADFDKIEESNLQRQILFNTASIGKNKATTAKNVLSKNNPLITINAHPEGLLQSNALELFAKYDIILDATDNYDSRYLINDAALITNKSVVYASIYKFEGQLSVFNYKNGPTYRCLFPQPPNHYKSCSEEGVLGVLAGIVGTLQANETIKIILGIGRVLSGKLTIINALDNQTQTIHFDKIHQKTPSVEEFYNNEYKQRCTTTLREISANEVMEHIISGKKIQTIDLREPNELPKPPLLERYSTLPSEAQKDVLTIVYCQSGVRSGQFVEKNKHTPSFLSLKGGINEWIKQFPNTTTKQHEK